MPTFGLERQPLRVPFQQSSGHRVRVVARLPKRVRGHGRPSTYPAVEDDRRLAMDRVRLRGDLTELEVPRARYPALVPLVGLADVDQLHLALAHELRDLPSFDVHASDG